jgi:hypothetical protein
LVSQSVPIAQTEEVAAAEENKDDKTVALSAYTPSAGTPAAQPSDAASQPFQFDFLPFIASAFAIGIGLVAIRTILAFIRERSALA